MAIQSKRFKVYDLEQPRFSGMPIFATHKAVGFIYTLHRQHKDIPLSGKTKSGAAGVLITSEHAGTHIDALCHQALNHRLYSGIPITTEVETPYGFTKLGAETIPPIVCRGVLLDLARYKGIDLLPKRYPIKPEDLHGCAKAQGTDIGKGDAVLVRTGYGRLWNDPSRYEKAAGVSLQGSRWIAERGVIAVGADNSAWEDGVAGELSPEMGVTSPSHVLFIVERGIYVIEHLNLEKLSADHTYEFLFICTPPKIQGATGSPCRPIALVEEG